MKSKCTVILLKQDWFIIHMYHHNTASPANYIDKEKFAELKLIGDRALSDGNIDKLRNILYELSMIQIIPDSGEGMFDTTNIVKG